MAKAVGIDLIYSAKRFIGRRWEEIQEEAKLVTDTVVKGPNDKSPELVESSA
jgi:hypothetical protein